MFMEVTYELIFMVVTATITGILGCVTKDRVIPSRFIPLQNIGIGVISAIVATYFNLFDDVALAILVSLATSLSVGGGYDATRIPAKCEEARAEEE